MHQTIYLCPYFPLPPVTLGALLFLMPYVSIAQDPSATIQFIEDQNAVLEEQFSDMLNNSPETYKEWLGAISDPRVIAEAMEADNNLILGAFPHGVPPKEILVLTNLVWELGYPAGTAEMLADEWGDCYHLRSRKTPRRGKPANDRGEISDLERWRGSQEAAQSHANPDDTGEFGALGALPSALIFDRFHFGAPKCGKVESGPCYLAPLRLLYFLWSTWQLLSIVLPPSLQGLIWSASISESGNFSPLSAHLPPCCS